MTRKEFIKHLGLLAAGSAALPEQIKAFEDYYRINSPKTKGPVVAIDEILLSGLATQSTPMHIRFFRKDTSILNMGLNAFGGISRWNAAPDHKIVTHPDEFYWIIDCKNFVWTPIKKPIKLPDYVDGMVKGVYKIDANGKICSKGIHTDLKQVFVGQLSYIDDSGRRQYRQINGIVGSLA